MALLVEQVTRVPNAAAGVYVWVPYMSSLWLWALGLLSATSCNHDGSPWSNYTYGLLWWADRAEQLFTSLDLGVDNAVGTRYRAESFPCTNSVVPELFLWRNKKTGHSCVVTVPQLLNKLPRIGNFFQITSKRTHLYRKPSAHHNLLCSGWLVASRWSKFGRIHDPVRCRFNHKSLTQEQLCVTGSYFTCHCLKLLNVIEFLCSLVTMLLFALQ